MCIHPTRPHKVPLDDWEGIEHNSKALQLCSLLSSTGPCPYFTPSPSVTGEEDWGVAGCLQTFCYPHFSGYGCDPGWGILSDPFSYPAWAQVPFTKWVIVPFLPGDTKEKWGSSINMECARVRVGGVGLLPTSLMAGAGDLPLKPSEFCPQHIASSPCLSAKSFAHVLLFLPPPADLSLFCPLLVGVSSFQIF